MIRHCQGFDLPELSKIYEFSDTSRTIRHFCVTMQIDIHFNPPKAVQEAVLHKNALPIH